MAYDETQLDIQAMISFHNSLDSFKYSVKKGCSGFRTAIYDISQRHNWDDNTKFLHEKGITVADQVENSLDSVELVLEQLQTMIDHAKEMAEINFEQGL